MAQLSGTSDLWPDWFRGVSRQFLVCVAVCDSMLCISACCTVLQQPNWFCGVSRHFLVCVAVCCSRLQCVLACCTVLQQPNSVPRCITSFPGLCCSVLQCVAMWCSPFQLVALCCSSQISSAVYHVISWCLFCSMLQCVLTCCTVLQSGQNGDVSKW